jgi:hypothetical protein
MGAKSPIDLILRAPAPNEWVHLIAAHADFPHIPSDLLISIHLVNIFLRIGSVLLLCFVVPLSTFHSLQTQYQ